MVVQPPDGPLEDTSDLAELWQQALVDFKNKTNLDLTKMQFKSMQEAMDSTNDQMKQFDRFRHDKGKVDAVRSALSKNLSHIETIVKGAKMAADAASVFPPAIPGAALMTAFTYVFKTFKDISADYDRVLGFFTEMGSFLDRISMLEEKSPKLQPFERCVKKVFASMLTLCGIAADYKEKKRFKKWLHALKDGSGDPALAGAYSGMEDAIHKLGEAVGVATLRTAIEIKETTTEINIKTDQVVSTAKDIKSISEATRQGVSDVREEVQHLDMSVTRVQTTIDTHQAVLVSKLDALLLQSAQAKKQDQKSKEPQRARDPATKKQKAFAQVRRHFADTAEVRKKLKAQRSAISDTLVKDTTSWIFQDELYKSWLDGSKPVLWLSGPAGIGKTFLAHAIATDLEKNHCDDHTSVATFFFNEDQSDLRLFRNALRCAVVQIAEKNISYCEVVASEISKNKDEEPWKQFFAARYPANSDSKLYLILDGVDEAQVADQGVMAELFGQISKEKLNIHILFTGRAILQSQFAEQSPPLISITQTQISSDLRKLVEARIRSLPRVRKFRKQTRKLIEDKIMNHADTMLYAEHMLRRLSAIGRESAVLKDLERTSPESLESLYQLLLRECRKGRTDEQTELLKTLFATLAFSKRTLNLEETSYLVKMFDSKGNFDIEDEVIGKSARILELGQDQDDDDFDDDLNTSDHAMEVAAQKFVDESGKTPLTFQERSLREYFQEVKLEEDSLRTHPADAHLLIFLLIVTILCVKSDATKAKEPGLRDYAARYWAHHFVEIDVHQLANDQIAKVMDGLRQIMSNKNDTTTCFELQNIPLYNDLERETSLSTRLQAWALHLSTLNQQILNNETQVWFETWSESPQKVFLSLAQSHVENWFYKDNTVIVSYRFAKSALKAAGVDLIDEKDTKECVLQVADYFPAIDKNATAIRRVAVALQNLHYLDEAIDFAKRCLEKAQDPSMECFFSYWIIAFCMKEYGLKIVYKAEEDGEYDDDDDEDDDEDEDEDTDKEEEEEQEEEEEEDDEVSSISDEHKDSPRIESNPQETNDNEDKESVTSAKTHPADGKFEEALGYIAKAMSYLPPQWKSDAKLLPKVANILVLQAICKKQLRKPEEALKSYNEYRSLRSATGKILDDSLMVRKWTKEPAKFFELVESWSDEERQVWLKYLFEGLHDNGDSLNTSNLLRYATLGGPTAIDRLFKWYDSYIKSLKPGSALAVLPLEEKALVYKTAMKDIKKTTEIYWEILNMEIKRDEYDGFDDVLADIRLDLADALFTQFRAATNPKEKLTLLDQMKQAMTLRINSSYNITQGQDGDWSSSNASIMYAIMVRTIGSNIDFQNIMEKTFSLCMEGLTDSVGSNDVDSFRLLSKILSCIPGLEHDAQIANSCQFSVVNPDLDQKDDEKKEIQQVQSALNNVPNGTSQKENNVVESTETKVKTIVEADPPAAVATKGQVSIEANPEKDETKKAKESDEDFQPDDLRYLWCDGCDQEFYDWSKGSIWFCLICANCDLCNKCYKLRMKWNEGKPCTRWQDFCGLHHRYLKAPVDGWHGVKNGVMRIGDGQITFQEWLRGLREERWPKAWTVFWTNESFLKNVEG